MPWRVITPTGSLDTSFGTGGVVVTDFGEDSEANALVLQADGKLVAGGTFGDVFRRLFMVARYHPDGSLDASFGSGGAVRTRFRRSFFGLQALVLQADGKLVAAGEADASGDSDFALARYVTTDEPLAVPRKCGGGRATILGTSRKDTIRGTRGPDVILALGGNDTIRGLGGNDTICGGPGLDTLIGNEGTTACLAKGRLPFASSRRFPGPAGVPTAGQNDKLFGDNGSDSRRASGPRIRPNRRVRR